MISDEKRIEKLESNIIERKKDPYYLMEEELKNERFPIAIYFIVPMEIIERFCYNSVRPMLNMYFQKEIGLDSEEAKSVVHMWIGLSFLFPLMGAAISDSYLGKFRTIAYFSYIFLLGIIMLAVFSINGLLATVPNLPLWSAIVPLVLIALGIGGLKPCVCSYGADQLPLNTTLENKYFQIYFLVINIGSLVSGYISPIMKEKIKCFGEPCYFLAFGFPSFLFVLFLVVFYFGRRYYINIPPIGEFLPYKALKISIKSAYNYMKSDKSEKKSSILEYYYIKNGNIVDEEFSKEIKWLFKVVVMFIPLIFYWVLYDQNGTEWQNQYNMLNPYLTVSSDYKIETEQLIIINILLVIIFVPLMTFVVYPFLEKRRINPTLLFKFNLGFILMIMAFLCSVALQYKINETNGQEIASLLNNGNLLSTISEIDIKCINCYSFLWQLPQWVLLSLSEAILFPAGGQFAYSEVGNQMKACSLSLWFLTTSIGNEFVFVFELIIKNLAVENRIWFYICVATLANIVFMLLSKYYYVYKHNDL